MNKKALYSFIIGFVLLIVVTVINRWSFDSMKDYTVAVDHSREVITSLERLSNHFKSAQLYSREYEEEYKAFYYLYRNEAEGLEREVARLQRLVQFTPDQKERVDSIGSWILQNHPVLLQKNITELVETGEGWRLYQLARIHRTINEAVVEELHTLADREIELRDLTRLTGTLTVFFTVIAIGLIAWSLISNLLLARKRNWLEGFLESVLNSTENGVVAYKLIKEEERIIDFEIEYANHAVSKQWSADPKKIVGMRLSEMRNFAQEYQLFERFRRVVETGRIEELEVLYRSAKESRWFYLLLAKREDGVTATFHDISVLKQYEGELKSKIEELEQSNAELEQYAYAASHDLQEPLRKIQIFSNYLQETQEKRLDESGRVHLTRIVKAAKRMSVLIRDILTFSSIKQVETYDPTDLNLVLKNVLQDLEGVIEQKEAEVYHTHLPVIDAIPLQITQLFYNLLSNALKFAHPERKPVVQLTVRRLLPDEVTAFTGLDASLTYYAFTCKDNGIGFPPKMGEQIFGLFKRLGDRHEYPGSGIGLALCRRVVLNHKGWIYAEGKEGEGACFYVLLPEKQVAALPI